MLRRTPWAPSDHLSHSTALAGNNEWGQLGIAEGDTSNRNVPSAVATTQGVSGYTLVSTGYSHTCAIAVGGAAFCFGYADFGELGQVSGDRTMRSVPTAVTTAQGFPSTWEQLAAGRFHTCGIATGGAAWCWGYNTAGQLGVGDTVDKYVPTAVDTSSGVTAFSKISTNIVDNARTCGVAANGASVLCWGRSYTTASDNSDFNDQVVPTVVSAPQGVSGWTEVATGGSHVLLIP